MTKTSRLRSRLLSAALALAMVFTMAPTGAFAADATIIVGAGGTTGYTDATAATLQKAFTDIADGGTVKMNSSIEDLVKTTILLDGGAGGKTVTLDLNGKTISGECASAGSQNKQGLICLKAGTDANLIITDTSEAKDGKIIGQTSGKAVVNYGPGTLTLQNGTVSTVGDLGVILVVDSGAFVMTGGTVESAGNQPSISNRGSTTISGGAVRGVKGYAISSDGAASKIEVSGGLVTSQSYIAIMMYDGSLKVTGGTISNTASPEEYSVYLYSDAVTYTKTGGTVGRVSPSYDISGTILGSGTNKGIPATLQLKNSSGEAVGDPVTATAGGSYTIKDVRPGTGYTITVSCDGYTEGTIAAFDVVKSNVSGKNLTLAKIQNIYTITFDVNAADFSGTVPTPKETNPDTDKLTSLPTITRDGYTFDGWFTAAEGGTQVTLDTVFTQDTTVYAHWTKITAPTVYTITFDVNATDFSGTVPAAQTTTADTFKLTSLPTVSRSGYTFDGWFTTADGGAKITLDTVFTQNTKVYAHWTKNSTGGGSNGGGSSGGKSSGSGTTAPASAADDFIDVQTHWAKSAIEYVVDKNLFKGITDTIFAPDAPMTRAMLWTVLARNASVDTTGGASWYEQAQLWVVSTKISDGTKPNGSITREELATILYRLAGSPDVSAMAASEFKDSSQVSAYAVDAIRWATSTGILKGTDTGRLAPKSGATRAEVATMLMRYLSK